MTRKHRQDPSKGKTMATYLRDEPIAGKWYLEERFKTGRSDPEGQDERTAHNQGVCRMRLAGPFDTEEAAKAARKDFPQAQQPFPWLCSGE
jgi:hypothetical protein